MTRNHGVALRRRGMRAVLVAPVLLGLAACGPQGSDPEPPPADVDYTEYRRPALRWVDERTVLLAYDEAARRVGAGFEEIVSLQAVRYDLDAGVAGTALGEAVDRGFEQRRSAIDADDRGNLLWVRESSPLSQQTPGLRVSELRACRTSGAAAPWDCQSLPLEPTRPGVDKAWSLSLEMTGGGQALLVGAVGIDSAFSMRLDATGGALARQALPDNLLPTPSLWGSVLRWHRSGVAVAVLGRTAETARVAMWDGSSGQWTAGPATASLLTADVDPASLHLVLHRDAPGFAPWLVGQRFDGSLLAARYDPVPGAWSGAQLLAAGEPAQQWAAEMAPGGEVFVAWATARELRARRWAGSWDAASLQVPAGAANSLLVAADAQGTATLLWGEGSHVLMTAFLPESGWLPVSEVGQRHLPDTVFHDEEDWRMALAVHPSGRVAAAWPEPAPQGRPGNRMRVHKLQPPRGLGLVLERQLFAGENWPIEVSLAAPAANATTVQIATSPVAWPGWPASLTIPAGQRSARVSLPTVAVANLTEVTLTARADGFVNAQAVVTAMPEPVLGLSGSNEIRGGETLNWTVSVTPALPVPITVQLSTTLAGLQLPASVEVPALPLLPQTSFVVRAEPQVSGAGEIVARARGATARAALAAVPNLPVNGWEPFADAIMVDSTPTVRLAESIVQTSPGLTALVALREDSAIHVNQIQGPPGSGSAAGRHLEVTPGGVIPDQPQLALGADRSTLVIAWQEGGRVRAKRRVGTTWASLGDALGASPTGVAYHPALRLDMALRPVLAWIEDGSVHVRRWDGNAWQAAFGTPPAPNRPLEVGDSLRLALDSDGLPVLAWTERDNAGFAQARVVRYGGSSWFNLGVPALVLAGAGLRIGVTVDASGVAWLASALQGEAGVQLRRHEPGTGWVSTGAPLQCVPGAVGQRVWDVALDAGHSATAHGPAAPMVAWVERGDGRACVARWNGQDWPLVGATAAARPSAPELIGLQAHDLQPAIVVTDFLPGFGRELRAWRFRP